jgi:uncharacterized protein (TIGR02284 family)
MLMSEGEIALDEVIIACKETVHSYQQAIDTVDDAQLSDVLKRVLQQRQIYTQELENHLRELGYLPREPDADRETLSNLFNRAKVLLADNDRLELLEEREQAEVQLADRVTNALQQALPESTLKTLHQLQGDVETVRERLREAKAAIQQ